jgi:hypothetical protein
MNPSFDVGDVGGDDDMMSGVDLNNDGVHLIEKRSYEQAVTMTSSTTTTTTIPQVAYRIILIRSSHTNLELNQQHMLNFFVSMIHLIVNRFRS